MPLAKLSERFYQKFGHDLVEELVTWLNEMDTGYRDDLRELNELNFARFDAKLEQRAAELDAKIDGVATRLDAKIDGVATRLDARIDGVATRLDAKIDRVAAQLEKQIEAQTGTLVKWMLGIYVITVPTLAGVVAVVQHFLPSHP